MREEILGRVIDAVMSRDYFRSTKLNKIGFMYLPYSCCFFSFHFITCACEMKKRKRLLAAGRHRREKRVKKLIAVHSFHLLARGAAEQM